MAIRSDKKINLLYLVETLGMGGAEMMIVNYIRALGSEHYRHYVYFFGHDGAVREKIEALDVPICMGKRMTSIKQPVKFIICLLSLIRDLMKFIKINHIQIIQSHLGHANQLAVAVGKLSGLPAFPTIHNTMPFLDRRPYWDLRRYIRKIVDGIIYRVADQVLVVSQEIKDIIHKKFRIKKSKIVVLKNGIIFDNSLSKPIDLEKEFLISGNTLKIITVGRLSYQKAMEIIIKAAAELEKQGMHDFFVMILGEGEERKQLEALIKDLRVENCVKLLGIRHDVIGLMKASDIFVIPSRYEGLSIAMIEAMACGLPIVASDAPGLNSYIEQGHNGILFPIGDYKALADCILRLAEDNNFRIQLSCGARESFMINHDMRKNIRPLALLIRNFGFEKQDIN
jgi:glycosyltransferase involved in cell wall biosynthesis